MVGVHQRSFCEKIAIIFGIKFSFIYFRVEISHMYVSLERNQPGSRFLAGVEREREEQRVCTPACQSIPKATVVKHFTCNIMERSHYCSFGIHGSIANLLQLYFYISHPPSLTHTLNMYIYTIQSRRKKQNTVVGGTAIEPSFPKVGGVNVVMLI